MKTLGLNTLVEHNYDYAGGNLIRESYGDTQLWFMYDESGSPVGLRRFSDGAYYTYYYIKNLQGDIVAIADSQGTIQARYIYDAWGNILSITDNNGKDISGKPNEIANINPLRYRGYYYDTETGLYYLKSRFYDPATGRFVNADSQLNPQDGFAGYNMYAYCGNNPVNYYDPNGNCFYGYPCNYGVISGYVVKMGDEIKCPHYKPKEIKNKEYYDTNDLRICTDGAPKGVIPDATWQETTAFTKNNNYLNALIVNYVVLPGDYSGNARLGDVAVLIDKKTNKSVNCIVGEVGPNDATFGEVSISAVWAIGYNSHLTANVGIDGDFSIIIYPGTKISWNWDNDFQTQIDARKKWFK